MKDIYIYRLIRGPKIPEDAIVAVRQGEDGLYRLQLTLDHLTKTLRKSPNHIELAEHSQTVIELLKQNLGYRELST